jgi:hypothetical protein
MKVIALSVLLGATTEALFLFAVYATGGSHGGGVSLPTVAFIYTHWPGHMLMDLLHLEHLAARLVLPLYALLWSVGWYFIVRKLDRWTKKV